MVDELTLLRMAVHPWRDLEIRFLAPSGGRSKMKVVHRVFLPDQFGARMLDHRDKFREPPPYWKKVRGELLPQSVGEPR